MNSSNLTIGRGWTVVASDGKRVGDVTEVHPHYLLVSRGVILVRDIYLPLGTVDRTEANRVILTVTYDTLKRMDLSHEPAPVAVEEPTAPLHDPAPTEYSGESLYQGDAVVAGEPVPYEDPWQSDESVSYDEMPTYNRPTPNGLVEVESGLNLGFQDLSYGPSVVLLQGWPFDDTIWEPLPGILANDHRVVSYDPRGVGRSDRPWDYYSVEIMTNDLHRLMVEQSLLDVTLVAWSSAALLALRYAEEHPGRVARLVLLAPLIPIWLADPSLEGQLGNQSELDGETQERWAAALLADRPAQHERLIDRLTDAPLSGPKRNWLWQRLMEGAPHAQIKTWETLRSYDPGAVLPGVKAPVTIISGEQDRLSSPALAAHLAALLPRAQTVVLGECGHATFLDQRETVVQMIRDLTGAAETARAMEEPYAVADEPWADTIEADAEGTSESTIVKEGETNTPMIGTQHPMASAEAGPELPPSASGTQERVVPADACSARQAAVSGSQEPVALPAAGEEPAAPSATDRKLPVAVERDLAEVRDGAMPT